MRAHLQAGEPGIWVDVIAVHVCPLMSEVRKRGPDHSVDCQRHPPLALKCSAAGRSEQHRMCELSRSADVAC